MIRDWRFRVVIRRDEHHGQSTINRSRSNVYRGRTVVGPVDVTDIEICWHHAIVRVETAGCAVVQNVDVARAFAVSRIGPVRATTDYAVAPEHVTARDLVVRQFASLTVVAIGASLRGAIIGDITADQLPAISISAGQAGGEGSSGFGGGQAVFTERDTNQLREIAIVVGALAGYDATEVLDLPLTLPLEWAPVAIYVGVLVGVVSGLYRPERRPDGPDRGVANE